MLSEFERQLHREGLSEETIKNYMKPLSLIDPHIKDWKTVTAKEIMSIMDKWKLKKSSIRTYRIAVNRFFKTNNIDTRLPRIKVDRTKKISVADLVSPEQIVEMVHTLDHPRDKALLYVCYESACRAKELLNLTRKDVVFMESKTKPYARLHIRKSKTGARFITIVNSVPYLKQYLNYRGNVAKNDPLWVNRYGRRMGYMALHKMLKKISKQVLKRSIHPHMLRHSRLTELVKNPRISDATVKEIAGWTQGTEMLSTYIHLASSDSEKTILEIHGIIPEEEGEPVPEPIKCNRCNTVNPVESQFCYKCGEPIEHIPIDVNGTAYEELRTGLEAEINELRQIVNALIFAVEQSTGETVKIESSKEGSVEVSTEEKK